jgi:hypothetical protein
MAQFNFEVLKETEKAVFAKVPYFEATHEGEKKHKQLYYECWIPKFVIEKGIAKDFVIGKRNEVRLSNQYQRKCQMPNSWKTLGEYAPVKIEEKVEQLDCDKVKQMIIFYEQKYGSCLSTLVNSEEGKNGYVTDEDQKIINSLMFPKQGKNGIPTKIITIYK